MKNTITYSLLSFLFFLKGSTADNSQATLHDYTETSRRLKNILKQDYSRILVGNSETGHREYLNNIYTDLYVVENETGGRVNDTLSA